MTDPRPSLRDTSGPDSPADPAAACLAEVREAVSHRRYLVAEMAVSSVDACELNEAQDRLAGHGARLLAAVEAVLELADSLPPQAAPASALEEDRMWIRQECASMIREAISRALLGSETSSAEMEG